jgi:acetoin utilization deacetylase AcuC-like enzyme
MVTASTLVAVTVDGRRCGKGEGYNINLPIPHGSPESAFFERLDEALAAVRLFSPDVLIVTLGFDIYREDPQAKVAVTSEGFNRMGRILNDQPWPVLVVQEGGYHLDSLAENTRQFFSGLGR